jgi:hypothetical protein
LKFISRGRLLIVAFAVGTVLSDHAPAQLEGKHLQQPVYKGQTTELGIAAQPNSTYYWSLYNDSSCDFALKKGDCTWEDAWFTDSISNQSAVNVKWNKAGTYFYKVLIINSDGCTNFKIGKMIILSHPISAPDPDIRIYPNPSYREDLIFQIMLAEDALVVIDLFSPNGQQVCRLFENYLPGGELAAITYKNELSQGIYLYKIRAGARLLSGKILVLRQY